MLIYTFGRLYYLAGLSWLLALALLAAGPAAAYVLYWRDGPPLLPAASLPLVDHALAGALVLGPLWPVLQLSFTPDGAPAELYALRCASLACAAVALVALVAHALSRTALTLCTVAYVGASLHLTCWTSALWLRLQHSGLAAFLPAPLRGALGMPLVVWLRQDTIGPLVRLLWRLTPVLLAPESELPAALAALPPDLRAALEAPILSPAVPPPLWELLQPWADGPAWLRVHRGAAAAINGDASAAHDAPAAARAAPAADRRRDDGGGGGGGAGGGGGGGDGVADGGGGASSVLRALVWRAVSAAGRRAAALAPSTATGRAALLVAITALLARRLRSGRSLPLARALARRGPLLATAATLVVMGYRARARQRAAAVVAGAL